MNFSSKEWRKLDRRAKNKYFKICSKKDMKKITRENKFKCPNGIEHATSYQMECHYFGCIHQINDTCPIIRVDDEIKKA